MNLRVAIRHNGKIIVGDQDDSHNTVIESKKLQDVGPTDKGFAPSKTGKVFLTRKMALGWLKKYDPYTYRKVIKKSQDEGLHSGTYAKAKGITQKELMVVKPKEIKQEKEAEFKEEINPKEKVRKVWGAE